MADHPDLNVLYCTSCGLRHRLPVRSDVDPIPACGRCGRILVRVRALLTALGLADDDYNRCERCDFVNPVTHLYCYACGRQLASDEAVAQLSGPAARGRKKRPGSR